MNPGSQTSSRISIGASARTAKHTLTTTDTMLVEPSSLFRVGLDYLLGQSRYRVVARIDAADDRSTSPDIKKPPDLIIVGTSVAGHGLVETVRDLKALYPQARLACVCKSGDFPDMAALLQAGIDGVVMADVDASVFIKSLDLVMSGETVVPHQYLRFGRFDDAAAEIPVAQPGSLAEVVPTVTDSIPTGLSAREREILQLLVNGDTNKMIGSKLSVSDATVKVHVKGILRKIQVQNRTQAAIWAIYHLSDQTRDR